MKRDNVGKIMKFLSLQEQEELYSIRDDQLEVYVAISGVWALWSDVQRQEENDYGHVESRIEDLACRPKGFLSWLEIHEHFEEENKGKMVKTLYGDCHEITKFNWIDNHVCDVGNGIQITVKLEEPNYGVKLCK